MSGISSDNVCNVEKLLKWISYKLRIPVDSIGSLQDLSDGLYLLKLIDIVTDEAYSEHLIPVYDLEDSILNKAKQQPDELSNVKGNGKNKVKYIGGPLSRFQKLANVEKLLLWLRDSPDSPFVSAKNSQFSASNTITVKGVGIEDILDSNDKLVPGLLWSIFWTFVLSSDDGVTEKRGILNDWLSRHVQSETDCKSLLKNFNLMSKLASSCGIKAGNSVYEILINAEIEGIPLIFNGITNANTKGNVDVNLDFAKLDDWSCFIYFSFWWDIFYLKGNSSRSSTHSTLALNNNSPLASNSSSTSTSTSISTSASTLHDKATMKELFGPNVLENANGNQVEYDLGLKLRIETFLVVVGEIIRMKTTFLNRLEKILINVIEWLGKFSLVEDEPIKEQPDLEDGEIQLSDDILKSLQQWTLVSQYRHGDKLKIYKEIQQLISYKGKLKDLLETYGLAPFEEPNEKSLDKISRLYSMLVESEESVLRKANFLLDDRIGGLNLKFQKNANDIKKGLKFAESDIGELYQHHYEKRILSAREILTDLRGISCINEELNRIRMELMVIHSRSSKIFDAVYYSGIIEMNKTKIEFLKKLLHDDLEFLQGQMVKKKQVVKVLRISQKSKELPNSVVHKMIQSSFNLSDTSAISVVFNRHDIGRKGYLTKSEFMKACGFIFPTMHENDIEEIFEIVYQASGNERRGLGIEQFKKIVESGMDHNEDKNEHVCMSPVVNTGGFENGKVTEDCELTCLTSDFHHQSWQLLGGNPVAFTKINLNERLKRKVDDIFVKDTHGEYDFDSWFGKVDESLIYQDIEGELGEVELENVLYDLEKVKLDL
ncbi:hypothetical protein DAMA08_014420 [Martiniozyma asiatica (nom. inval.)]|nr:hypothetical protein DAMA08_014420 [Martiniozyma asiatica]